LESNPTKQKDLSLVIPCYNESPHIEASVKEILFCLSLANIDWEIILINDCSPDNTLELLQQIEKWDSRIQVLNNEKNLGRGATVEKGFKASQAQVVGYIDIDLSTSPVYIPYFVKKIQSGELDVATAFRIYQVTLFNIHQTFIRTVLSIGYRYISHWMLGHTFKDTEAGYKFFNREKLLPVLEQIQDNHWFWDTEVMIFSKRLGLKAQEIDTLFDRKPEKKSTVKIFSDTRDYLMNLRKLRRRLKTFAQT